jgi:hypothetical protein
MKLAKGHAVADDRFAVRVAVRRDVCGIQQLLMAKAAKSAPLLVGPDDPLSEHDLMEALSNRAGHIGPPSVAVGVRHPVTSRDIG